ncbi:MAG: hypothetical protein MJB57_17990 [Gemmatimonadetes bacterium]|nr:hypothetical protein [Gemmatimonadota bacterium]
MYLIGEQGLPTQCPTSAHREISWSEGGGTATSHVALTGLDRDDHPQYVLVDRVRTAVDGFAVSGTFGSGSIPASGSGVRMMWYPGKAAFRVGQTISEWTYTSEPGVRHVGPVAEDFHAALGLGGSDRHIASLDVGGVALAAIQALAERVKRLERENSELRAKVEGR